MKRKSDAGDDRAITQFFFSPECFFRFRDEAAAAGIEAELVPGILPVSNVAQTRKFAAACGAAIPAWMDKLFEGLDDLPAARQLVAATVAAELCGQLYAGGVRQFHFYTLNPRRARLCDLPPVGLRRRKKKSPMNIAEQLRAEAREADLVKDGAYGTQVRPPPPGGRLSRQPRADARSEGQ